MTTGDSHNGSDSQCRLSDQVLANTHNETRSWHGWHRHVSLVMLAFAMLATIRRKANTLAPPKSSLTMIRKSRR